MNSPYRLKQHFVFNGCFTGQITAAPRKAPLLTPDNGLRTQSVFVRQVSDIAEVTGYPLHEESVKKQIEVALNVVYLF